MAYTEAKEPGKLWDTLALFKGSVDTGFLYTSCAHHAEQIPIEEGRRFKKEELEVRAWLHFPTPQGGKECTICYQLWRGDDPGSLRPISRVNVSRRVLR